jgi:hypothetical protein
MDSCTQPGLINRRAKQPHCEIAFSERTTTPFNMKQQLVEGDYAYILWTAETADNVYELATDTFVVRQGKIVAQSFTAKIMPKG